MMKTLLEGGLKNIRVDMPIADPALTATVEIVAEDLEGFGLQDLGRRVELRIARDDRRRPGWRKVFR